PQSYVPNYAECLTGARKGFPPPPEDPALRARVREVRRDLGMSRAAGRTDLRRAASMAAASVEAARALEHDYPGVLAEALVTQAGALLDLQEYAEAERLYD